MDPTDLDDLSHLLGDDEEHPEAAFELGLSEDSAGATDTFLDRLHGWSAHAERLAGELQALRQGLAAVRDEADARFAEHARAQAEQEEQKEALRADIERLRAENANYRERLDGVRRMREEMAKLLPDE